MVRNSVDSPRTSPIPISYEVNSEKNDEFEMVVDFVKSDIFDKEKIRFERQ